MSSISGVLYVFHVRSLYESHFRSSLWVPFQEFVWVPFEEFLTSSISEYEYRQKWCRMLKCPKAKITTIQPDYHNTECNWYPDVLVSFFKLEYINKRREVFKSNQNTTLTSQFGTILLCVCVFVSRISSLKIHYLCPNLKVSFIWNWVC